MSDVAAPPPRFPRYPSDRVISLRMPDNMHMSLRILAARKRRHMQDIILELILSELEAQPVEMRT